MAGGVGCCIILGEFFQSFSFYGIKTVLFLFLFSKMDYTKDESTYLFHIFLILMGTLPLLCICIIKILPKKLAITAALSFFYMIGCTLLVLGLILTIEVPTMQIQVPAWVTIFTGLVLIAICEGGIRIFLFAAGLEQFKLPEQEKNLKIFLTGSSIFSFFGAALSTAIAPVLRDDFHCCDDYGCFPLVFAPFGIIMILATVMFVAGSIQHVVKPRHDVSPQQYSYKKGVFIILLLYLHLTLFWALFEQQSSRWTLQATRMDGELWGCNIKPDQMQLSHYLLKLFLLPLIHCIIYPILYLIGIRTPLLKIVFGGLLAAAAFYLAACLEVNLEKLDPVLPNSTTAQLRVYNGMHCDYSLSQILHSNYTESVKVEPLGYYEGKDLQKCNVSFRALDNINAKSSEFTCTKDDVVKAIELGDAMSFFIRQDFIKPYKAHVDKPKLGTPIVRPLINIPQTAGNFTLKDSANLTNSLDPYSTKAIIVTRGEVSLLSNDSVLTTFVARSGCVYVLLGHRNAKLLNEYEFRTYNTVEPNTIHMMWQLPQYICITAGEIMVTKNVFEFTLCKAPAKMQAALQSTWSLTMALGNLLAVIIMNFKFCEAQSDEYRLFAFIMLIDMIIFLPWAMCCKCVKPVNVKPANVQPENVKPVNMKPKKVKPVNVESENLETTNSPEAQDQQKLRLSSKKTPLSVIPKSRDQRKSQDQRKSKEQRKSQDKRKSQDQRKSQDKRKSQDQGKSQDQRKSQDRGKSKSPRSTSNLPRIPESENLRKSSSEHHNASLTRILESEDRRKSSLPRKKNNLPQISESRAPRKSSLSANKTDPKPRPSKTDYPQTSRNSRSPRKKFSSSSSTSSSPERSKSLPNPRKSSSPASPKISKSTYNLRPTRTSTPRSSTKRSSSSARPKASSAPTTQRPRPSGTSNNKSSSRRSSYRRSYNQEPTNQHDTRAFERSDEIPHILIHNHKVVKSEVVYVPYIPPYHRN